MSHDINQNERIVSGRRVRWNAEVARSAYACGLWVRETLADAARRAAHDTPQRVVVADGQVQLSCASLFLRANKLAQWLLRTSLPGGVVSMMLPNWHEAAEIYLAATLAGLVVQPILPSLRERELLFMLSDAASGVVFVPAEFRNHDYRTMLQNVLDQLGNTLNVVVVRGDAGAHIPYGQTFEERETHTLPQVDPDSVRMIMYTSGTTGTPKGVMHSHNSIHAQVLQKGRYWQVNVGDTFLVPSPISHIGGSVHTFELPLLLGTSAVLMDRWDAKEAIRLCRAERCTHIAGATPFLAQLADEAERQKETLPDLKVYVCGGASVPPSLIQRAAAQFPSAAITRCYGSTEVPVTTVGAPARGELTYAAETDGRLGFADVKIVGGVGHAEGEGEICARGPQMLVGYLHADDEASVFDEDGFYRTGDIGRFIDERYLLVCGRRKDIIIRNGENISPKEIEDLLAEYAPVAEVTIVGTPDPVTGERACAVIVSRHGAEPPNVETIHQYLTSRGVAQFKIPEMVTVWDALPKNDAGKVLKHQVRAELLRQRQAS